MNLQYLRYALEISRTGSISKAAENLSVAQPNLSRAVKELESQLGISIFERTRTGMTVTPEGERLLSAGERILREVGELETMFDGEAIPRESLSVMAAPSAYAAHAFVSFCASLPEDRIYETRYSEGDLTETLDAVVSGTAKLGIIRIPLHFEKYYTDKLTAKELRRVLKLYEEDESREHTVMPGAAYISHPTELGTLYTKSELAEISEICRQNSIPLFLDGARLGYGISAPASDLSLPDIAKYCDLFYIGGTKCGAMIGEALVITDKSLCKSYFSMMKRHGAVLAKGRILGIQFDTLFTDNLYFEICKNGVMQALYLKEELAKRGYEFFIDSPTNQQFIVISNEKYREIKDKIGFTFWEKMPNGNIAIRLVTSFMTTKEQVDELLSVF